MTGAALLGPLVAPSSQQVAGLASEAYADDFEEPKYDDWRTVDPRSIPIDQPRTLDDYNRLMTLLEKRRRGYLIRDVFQEMSLAGVRPDRRSYYVGLFASMKQRRLGDAMFFWEEMQRRGFEPDAPAYTGIISACGRCGQLKKAVELRNEMRQRGVALTRNTYLALLQAFAEAGRLRSAREILEEMEGAGFPPDEPAYAALISGYRKLDKYKLAPSNEQEYKLAPGNEQEVLGLLEAAKARAGSALPGEGHWGGEGASGLGLAIYNSALSSLAAMGHHAQVLEVFRRVREEEGLAPDATSYANLIRSHLGCALGMHRQPQGAELTSLIEERLAQLDLAPFIQQVKEDLEMQRLAGGGTRRDVGSDAVSDAEESDVDALGSAPAGPPPTEAAESEEEVLSQTMTNPRGGSAAQASPHEPPQEQQAMHEGQPQQAQQGGQQQQQQLLRPSGGGGKVSAKEDQALLRKAEQRARARVRFEILAEHTDLDAWYQALHCFQEVLDAGLGWGPELGVDLVRASLALAPTRAEDAVEVAHAMLDKMQQKGFFLDVDTGSELLMLAVRRDVGDLSLAHKLWDMLRRSGRFPRTPVVFKYMRAICQREPHKEPDRVRQVCTTILNDPDRSDACMRMKSEAFRKREVFGGHLAPRQHKRQQAQRGAQQTQQQEEAEQE
ncbi:hypothetical protein N2152v2_001059 [Parachlorella kessleri]